MTRFAFIDREKAHHDVTALCRLLQVSRSVARQRAEALVVEDAVQCGTCRPRPQPVAMPELD